MRLLNSTQAAARVGVGLRTFHQWCADYGWPKHMKIGRTVVIKDSDLLDWLAQVAASKKSIAKRGGRQVQDRRVLQTMRTDQYRDGDDLHTEGNTRRPRLRPVSGSNATVCKKSE